MKSLVEYIKESLVVEGISTFFNRNIYLNNKLINIAKKYKNKSVLELISAMINKLGESEYEAPMDNCGKYPSYIKDDLSFALFRIRLNDNQYNIAFSPNDSKIGIAKRIRIAYSGNGKNSGEILQQDGTYKKVRIDGRDNDFPFVWFNENDKVMIDEIKKITNEINDCYHSTNKHIEIWKNVPVKELYIGLTGDDSNKASVDAFDIKHFYLSVAHNDKKYYDYLYNDEPYTYEKYEKFLKMQLTDFVDLLNKEWNNKVLIMRQKVSNYFYYMFVFENGYSVTASDFKATNLIKTIKKYKSESI